MEYWVSEYSKILEFIFKHYLLFFEIRFRAILDTGVISEKDGQGSGQAILILEFISGKDGQGDYRVFPTASCYLPTEINTTLSLRAFTVVYLFGIRILNNTPARAR